MTVAGSLPRMSAMKSSNRMARRLLLLAALAGMALPALPQSPGYTVEIVVFRNGGDIGALADAAAGPYYGGDDVEAVAVTSRRLGGSVSRLNNSGLRVLGQAAWRQDPAPWQQNRTAWDTARGVSASRLGASSVTGKVVFLRGEYLHLGLDLLVEDRGKRYRLHELRQQIKTDQILYFDHPAIGAIAYITRN